MKVSEKMIKSLPVSKASDSGLPVPGVLPINPKGSLVDVSGWVSAGFSDTYDCQTQGGVYPMAKLHDDQSFIGCIWTTSDAPPIPGNPDGSNRNVGYSYSTDKGKTWSEHENRLGEISVYWGSYAQWGKNGEAVMARSFYDHEYEGVQIKDGLVLFTRETRGEGDWTITPVPYPADSHPAYFMAWGSMTTSGDNHQYIHIITPMSTRDVPGALYHGYSTPMLYFRTQDGKTWEIEGEVVPEMMGQEWEAESYYADGTSWAVQGNTIACSFINLGSHGYVVRSHDNGNTWEGIKFFDNPVRNELTPDDYLDSVYAPAVGCVALDNNRKIHIAFAAIRTMNSAEDGVSYWPWAFAQFLSYWNEDMGTIDGDTKFNTPDILPLLMGYNEDGKYFDWEKSTDNNLYVISTVPEWPVIGYFIPVRDDHYYTFLEDAEEWAGKSYAQAGMFSFPQMVFDVNNTLHLAYLGLLDGGNDDSRWKRHPFYTTRTEDGTWTQTEYLVNTVNLVDYEFAYLTSAGIGDEQWYLMAQVDQYAGTHIPAGIGPPSDHDPVKNNFYFFHIDGLPPIPPAINEIDALNMTLAPNPASGQVTVNFEGIKGNITVYNMLGQVVYHAENIENKKDISLSNMTTGVYFVTLRSGNATATQKLIVK
jgi:hypothetical protein